MKDYLDLSNYQRNRLENVTEKYKQMHNDPANCEPKFIINTPTVLPDWEERLSDPLVMLKANLDALQPHFDIEDDRVATVRVDFGTAQVAAAFGCDLVIPTNNLPAAANHVLKNIEDVFQLKKPSLDAGWYGKLKEWTEVYLQNLPEGVHIQHPDIQSCFNTAHLIRGNDILLDFYDKPKELGVLLDLVTEYMTELIIYLKTMISSDKEWFYDWGALWKGSARISNCSMHMISPDFYTEHILPRDLQLLRNIGGGRVHYCGTSGQVIQEFFKNPEVSGLDFDGNHHVIREISKLVPEKAVLLQWMDPVDNQFKIIDRLLDGDWPEKKNIIFQFNADSVQEGKELLAGLKNSYSKSI
jgi:hypothetical protein